MNNLYVVLPGHTMVRPWNPIMNSTIGKIVKRSGVNDSYFYVDRSRGWYYPKQSVCPLDVYEKITGRTLYHSVFKPKPIYEERLLSVNRKLMETNMMEYYRNYVLPPNPQN